MADSGSKIDMMLLLMVGGRDREILVEMGRGDIEMEVRKIWV